MDILIEEFEENIWAIALKNGRIEGIEIDPPNEEVRWGSIYWAKVTRIDKSMDAAFVDLDGDNTGILYNRDVRYTDKNGIVHKGGDQAIGKTLKSGDMIAVQAKGSYLVHPEDNAWGIEDKSTQVSMDITIQGRHLIYGTMMQKNRLSSRINGKKLRNALKLMLENLEDIQGFILRSSASDTQTEVLRREAKILENIWQQISAYFEGNEPSLIALGPDAIQRILGDNAMKSIDRIEVVTMDHFEQIEDWCQVFAPDLVTKIKPVEVDDGSRDLALFEHRDVLGQIESLFHNYILLPSGGSIIIQETAALTAIDVNTGSDKRGHLSTNIESAKEIGRQIRLRNTGGIVIIDFLKVKKSEQKELLDALTSITFSDPCTVQIHGFTNLGLMEISRKRRSAPLQERLESIEF